MSDSLKRRPSGLGRGLSALLGDVQREEPVAALPAERPAGVQTIAVASINPNPRQPRRLFDEAALQELAGSIATRGVIQPIVVRPAGSGYQIVAGERRWRAAQIARLHDIPAIVRDFNDAETLEIALLENIQRQDLNAIEEAEGYARLIGDFGHTQEELGKLVSKSRSHVSNLLRLLDLPLEVRESVVGGAISMGHARALITAPNPRELAQQVVAKGLSVRETEKLARAIRPDNAPRRFEPKPKEADADLLALERQLGDVLGLKVSIVHRGQGGTVTLAYSSLDQLDMVCQRLSGEPI